MNSQYIPSDGIENYIEFLSVVYNAIFPAVGKEFLDVDQACGASRWPNLVINQIIPIDEYQ